LRGGIGGGLAAAEHSATEREAARAPGAPGNEGNRQN